MSFYELGCTLKHKRSKPLPHLPPSTKDAAQLTVRARYHSLEQDSEIPSSQGWRVTSESSRNDPSKSGFPRWSLQAEVWDLLLNLRMPQFARLEDKGIGRDASPTQAFSMP